MDPPSTAASRRHAQATAAAPSGDSADEARSRPASSAAQTEIDPRLPLVIGVTGHRDLRADARPAIAAQVREILLNFKTSYPSTPLVVLSPLAEGADRLVAEVALEKTIGATLTAPLPMRREIYEHDFKTADSLAEFDRLLAAATHRLELPTPPGVGDLQLETVLAARQEQYAAVGEFIARHCQVLIALWDGKPAQRGGTGEVVELKLKGELAQTETGRSPQAAVPPGPVFHIMSPRERQGSRDIAIARMPIYPESEDYELSAAHQFHHHRIFKPLDDYNREIATRAAEERAEIDQVGRDLMPDLAHAAPGEAAAGVDTIRRHYAVADTLANRYGASTNGTLYRLTIVVFLAALSFDFAVHMLLDQRLLALRTLGLFGLPILTGVAMLIDRRAKRGDYQNRYQDYRGLAEGLRVQFYWRLAGVDACVADHYLGRHRRELQWIRGACRSSLVAANWPLGRNNDETAKVVFERWIQSQGDYFGRAAARQQGKLERFERRIRLCFWLGFAIVLVLGVWSALLTIKRMFDPPILAHLQREPELLLGALLLTVIMTAVIAALTHNYVEKLALRTQVRMYERMRRLYQRHGTRLRTARGAAFIHGLFNLGQEALVENGDWVMTHRERPLEVPRH
jgi:hypothetical protein